MFRSIRSVSRGIAKGRVFSTISTPIAAEKTAIFAPSVEDHDGIYFRYLASPRTVSLVGVPLALGQNLDGVDTGPDELRRGGLAKRIKAESWGLIDNGDIEVPKSASKLSGAKNFLCAEPISEVNKATAEKTFAEAKNNKFVLTVGGDHSIAIGSIAGILKARPDTAILWVDAHADINTPQTTNSGHIHGMCLSLLMKHPDSVNAPEYAWLKDYPALDPRRLAYVGLRDLDKGEKKIIRDFGIKAFTMKEVDKLGIGAVMEQAIDHLRGREDRPIHLSFDIDGVDPIFAPSTGTRVGGGLTYRESYYICESLAETGLLSSMDLVEVNAMLTPGDSSRTVDLANGLIATALGSTLV